MLIYLQVASDVTETRAEKNEEQVPFSLADAVSPANPRLSL
jgi:hypothetical protein